MQRFLGIGRTGRYIPSVPSQRVEFRLFHLREWNNWKSRNGDDRFRWTLDFYSGIG